MMLENDPWLLSCGREEMCASAAGANPFSRDDVRMFMPEDAGSLVALECTSRAIALQFCLMRECSDAIHCAK
jgi:hypothetical protein